ncbi:unnamed protein product, partial [Mesorhabditis belari]|uniref:Uncharacterized protein n=1 Tax=Mesorhabditis belari TaxID=2138241 RepID=A0AAF3EAI6_9BILA
MAHPLSQKPALSTIVECSYEEMYTPAWSLDQESQSSQITTAHHYGPYEKPPQKKLRIEDEDTSRHWQIPVPYIQITDDSPDKRNNKQRNRMSFAMADDNLQMAEQDASSLRQIRKRKMELIEEIQSLKNEMHEIDSELETLYYVDDGSKSKSKLMSQGKKKFNQEPEKGLQWMIERGLLSPTPSDVAQWLYKCTTEIKGVSKAAIGDYLGLNDPFVLEVLQKYCEFHSLAEMHIVDALRLFLASFRLPGESQKIDRIIEKFAAHYTKANPTIFKSPDVCYILAYSCVMLNTLLHNPSVKDKPSFERFLSMNRDFVTSGDIQQSMLGNIYDSIKQQAFKLPNDSLGSLVDHADYDGWLFKQSSNQFLTGPLSWKRRWFILSDSCLYYFEHPKDKEPRGIIPLQNVGIKRVENAPRPHTFEIYSVTRDERIKACKTESDGRLDERSQVMALNVWVEHYWKDERVKWDPGHFGNISKLSVSTKAMWTPDIVLFNNARDFSRGFVEVNLHVTSDGDGMYDKQQLDLQIMERYDGKTPFTRDSFTENGEWQNLASFPVVVFELHLRRRMLYFLYNIIYPCVMLSVFILTLMQFILPCESGEKVRKSLE